MYEDFLPVLFDLSITIGRQDKLANLLTRTLQRLLFHTSYSCGFACLNLPPEKPVDSLVFLKIDAAIGDIKLMRAVGKTVAMPCKIFYSKEAEGQDDLALMDELTITHSRYRSYQRIEIENNGVIILLSSKPLDIALPLSQILRPVMAHLSKAIDLCRKSEAYTANLLQQQRLMAKVFDSSHSGVAITDVEGRITEINPAFTRLTQYLWEEVSGRHIDFFMTEEFGHSIKTILSKKDYWEGEVWQKKKNGETFPVWQQINPILDDTHHLTNYIFLFSDISERKNAETKIHQLAYFDPLTFLPNRRMLIDKLTQVMNVTKQTNNHGAILFLDLDNFKAINDTKGHQIGDYLLIEVARRLAVTVRNEDIVSRIGGDEFVVVVQNLSQNFQQAVKQAFRVSEKLLHALAQPYLLEGHECRTTSSIGIALFQNSQESIDVLLSHADTAMYQAKKSGCNNIQLFDPKMQAEIESTQNLVDELRSAVNHKDFVLYFQKQVDSQNNTIGAEALLRWNHPRRGLILPQEFIPMAEETGMITELGAWVIESACKQLKEWESVAQARHLSLSVNVSAKQFRRPDFVDVVRHIVIDSRIEPSKLKLEVTESTVLDDVETTVIRMHELKSLGLKISMDDFGTGYSSLRYLKQFPLDQLKIDREFIRDVTTERNDAMIVQAIIAMANAMGLDVLAEGVETKEQQMFLEAHGCASFQGFLFGKPVPIEQFETGNYRNQLEIF